MQLPEKFLQRECRRRSSTRQCAIPNPPPRRPKRSTSCRGGRFGRCGCNRGRCWRRFRGFTQQSSHLRRIQCGQTLASAARLFRGDRGLAPLLSFCNPFGDFRTDGTADSGRGYGSRRRRCGRRRCGCSGCGRFIRLTQQCGDFGVIQRGQTLTRATRLLSRDGRLAPFLSLRHPLGDFLADASPPGPEARPPQRSGRVRQAEQQRRERSPAAAGTPEPPSSHDMGCPALRASISASVSSGSPLRWRYACSMPITELLSAGRGKGGSCPRIPVLDSSAIRSFTPSSHRELRRPRHPVLLGE